MEQQPPSRSTPPPPPPPPPGGAAGPSKEAASKAAAPAKSAPADADGGGLPGSLATVCPACGEPRAEDARYCEECGHDFESAAPTPAPQPEEKTGFSGPVLWLIMVFWVVLAVAGLVFLFTALWSL